jgi:hypothetical protein
MENRNDELINKFCRVIVKDGCQLVCLPDGTEIPYVQMTRITQDLHQASAGVGDAFIKLLVRLDNTE